MLNSEQLLASLAGKYVQHFDDYGRHLFNALKPHIVAAFYLEPIQTGRGEEHSILYPGTPEHDMQTRILYNLPFPCIRIKRTLIPRNQEEYAWKSAETDTIICNIVNDNGKVSWIWAIEEVHIYHDGTRKTFYAPSEDVKIRDNANSVDNVPESFMALMQALENRQNRYIHQPISRQVRRREGFSSTYHEYVIIRKPKVADAKCLRLSEIMRRHPMLHAVRGHLRHYQSGLVVKIKPHLRGKGDMVQVKDYITEEEYYSES